MDCEQIKALLRYQKVDITALYILADNMCFEGHCNLANSAFVSMKLYFEKTNVGLETA